MKTISLAFCLLVLGTGMDAQLEGVINEVIYTDDGSIPGYPAGYSTYHIYALLADDQDVITSVFGSSIGISHPLQIGSTEPNAIWNAADGGNYGQSTDCALFTENPATAYDSYVTIGLSSATNDDCPDCAGTESSTANVGFPPIGSSFGDVPFGGDLNVTEGIIFVLNDGNCNGHGQGTDHRVLLAQMTVPTGTLYYCLNLQVIDDGLAGNSLIYVNDTGDPAGPGEIDGMPLGICGAASTSVNRVTLSDIAVYPNPADNCIQVEARDNLDAIYLYSIGGQRLISVTPGSKRLITLETGSLAPGLYVLEAVLSSGHNLRRQVMIY
jgi:hypothetical protein